jgi:hypothetical protein
MVAISRVFFQMVRQSVQGLIDLKGNRFDGSVVPISGTSRRHKEHPVKDHLGLLARVQNSAESPHGYLSVLPVVGSS